MARTAAAKGVKTKRGHKPAKKKRAGKRRGLPVSAQGMEFLDERLSKALAHWIRVNIMAIVSWRKISPSEFARETGLNINTVSYHFKRLLEYGVIELIDKEQVRGAVKHYYRGTRQAIFGGAAWTELPKSVQDGVTGAALQDLMKVTVHSIESGAFSGRDDSYLIWEPVTYDDLAFKAAIKILELTRERLLALQEEAKSRLARTKEDGMLVAIGQLTFEMGDN